VPFARQQVPLASAAAAVTGGHACIPFAAASAMWWVARGRQSGQTRRVPQQ